MNAANAKSLRRLRSVIDPQGRRPDLEKILKRSYYSWNAPKRARMMAHVRRVLRADPAALAEQIRERRSGIEEMSGEILSHFPKQGQSMKDQTNALGMAMLKGAPLVMLDQAAKAALPPEEAT